MVIKGKIVKATEVTKQNGEVVVSKFSGKPLVEALVMNEGKIESVLISDGIAKKLMTLEGITGTTTLERLNALKASGREVTFAKITDGKYNRWEVL